MASASSTCAKAVMRCGSMRMQDAEVRRTAVDVDALADAILASDRHRAGSAAEPRGPADLITTGVDVVLAAIRA